MAPLLHYAAFYQVDDIGFGFFSFSDFLGFCMGVFSGIPNFSWIYMLNMIFFNCDHYF